MSILDYVKIAAGIVAAVLVGLVIWYIGDLRTTVADQKADLVAKDATIGDLQAAAKINLAAIDALKTAKANAEAALTDAAAHQQSITAATAAAKEQVHHVQVSSDCRGLDARDLDVFDRVRGLVAPGSASDRDADGQGPAAGRANGGHSAAPGAGHSGQP